MKNQIVKAYSTTKLQVKKYSPELLLGAGIIGIGATIYLAIKATKEVDKTLEEFEGRKAVTYSENEVGEEIEKCELHSEDKKELIKKVAIQVAPAVGTGILSLGCICASYGIINKRVVLLGGVLGTTTEKLNNYRERIKKEYGEEVEERLFNGVKKVTRETTNEKGKTVVEEFDSFEESPSAGGAFRFIWDENATQFVFADGTYNKLFLDSKEKEFNDRLLATGYVFLNDVLRALGIDPVPVGQLVGWTTMNGAIDFGAYKTTNEWDERVLLDFNVQGYIYNQL